MGGAYLNRDIFALVKTVEKAELSKCSWYPKRDDIASIWKKHHTFLYILLVFRIIVA